MKFVLRVMSSRAATQLLCGLLLIAPAVCALSCRYIKHEHDQRPVQAASLRFNVKDGSVWMWRDVLDAQIGSCILRDFPTPMALTAAQSLQMQKAWLAQNREEFFSPALAREAAPVGAVLVAPEGAPPLRGLKRRHSPAGDANNDRDSGELLGQNLSLIRREQAQALIPNPAFLNAAVRFGAHRCQTAMGGRGSALLMAPTLILTAAHVVADENGALCEAYRAVPGGDSYLVKEPSPLGVYISSRVQLSERGGWKLGETPFPVGGEATQAQFEARTRHDWAIGSLKSKVRGVHVWPLLRFVVKAQSLADCHAHTQNAAIVKIGYPIRGFYGEIRRGKATANRGYSNCGAERPPVARFSLFTNPGDSGAGIFALAQNENMPLELRSLVSVSEMRNSLAIESLGPSFDLTYYQQMLRFLQNHR